MVDIAIVGDQFKEVDTTNVDGAWFTRLLQHGLTGFTPFYTIAQGPYGGGGRRFQCICKHAGIALPKLFTIRESQLTRSFGVQSCLCPKALATAWVVSAWSSDQPTGISYQPTCLCQLLTLFIKFGCCFTQSTQIYCKTLLLSG